MPVPIAVAVIEHEGKFLVARRPEGAPLAGLWEFPGGRIEMGETPEQAALRECLEETGLEIEIVSSFPEQVQQYDRDSVRLHFFSCRLRDPQATAQRPWGWVERRSLAELEFPAGNRRLLEILTEK